MEDLARAILDAQLIREESYDVKAAAAAEKYKHIYIDYENFYKKTHMQAADEAAGNAGLDKRGTLPVYLLNKYCWNDIQAWAEETLGMKTIKVLKNREGPMKLLLTFLLGMLANILLNGAAEWWRGKFRNRRHNDKPRA